jgi:hypothetical protein
MVDDGEGPIFYCPDLAPDEMTLDELERRAELIRQVEVAEIAARIFAFATDDQPSDGPPAAKPPPYRPAQSTIDAFWYVVGLNDSDRLKAWLLNHPKDAPHLHKLWKAKR